jgi:hypothetical protein
VGGERTDQILARVQSDVVAYQPGYCHVLAGTNDVAQAVPMATIQANFTAIWNVLDAAGIRVLTGTIPPRATYTGTMQVDTLLLNNWLRAQGRVRRNLTVIDYFSVLVAPGLATGRTDLQALDPVDGIHPTAIGAGIMGRELSTTISTFAPASLDLPTAENIVGNGNLLQYWNRFRQSTAMTVAPPSGWVQSWTGTVPTFSGVARTDNIPGKWQQIVVPSGTQGTMDAFSYAFAAGTLQPGDTIYATAEYQVSSLPQSPGGGTSGFGMVLGTSTALNSGGARSGDLYYFAGNPNFPSFDRSGVFRTPPYIIPTGGADTTVLVRFFMTAGTYLLDRVGIFKV